MKKISIIVAIAILITTLAGCAGRTLEAKILNQHNRTWKIEHVNAHYKNGVIKISGQMKPSKSFAKRQGHIDITILTLDGELLIKKIAPLGRRVMRRGGDYFSFEYPVDVPVDSIITVEYNNQSNSDNN